LKNPKPGFGFGFGFVDKEIEDMIAMGVIERSEAAYASPLVLVKKADGSYRVCVNFKELNKITVFDPEPMMSVVVGVACSTTGA